MIYTLHSHLRPTYKHLHVQDIFSTKKKKGLFKTNPESWRLSTHLRVCYHSLHIFIISFHIYAKLNC